MKHLKSLLIFLLGLVLNLNAQDKPNILVIWGDDIGFQHQYHIARE
jgi:hypothetical protein